MTHVVRLLGIVGAMGVLLWGLALLSFAGEQDMGRMLLCCAGLFGSAIMGHSGLTLADRMERVSGVSR